MSETIREKILSASDLKSEMFTSKTWGVTVKVRGISRGRRVDLTKECQDESGKLDIKRFAPALIIETFVDPLNDAPVFTRADLDVLNGKSWSGIEEALSPALRVSGYATEEQEKVMEKNSEETPSAGSPSV